MAAANVEIAITAAVADFRTQMGSAAKTLQDAVKLMGDSFKEVKKPTEEHGSIIDKVSEKLREHRKEHVATARAVNSFTKEIKGIIGPGNELTGVLGGLAGGLAMGGALGLAVEGVKLLAEEFTKAKKEAAEFAKASTEYLSKIADETQKALDKLAGVTEADKRQRELDAVNKLLKDRARLEAEVAEAKEKAAGEYATYEGEPVDTTWTTKLREAEKELREFDERMKKAGKDLSKDQAALSKDIAALRANDQAEADETEENAEIAHNIRMLTLRAELLDGRAKEDAEFEAKAAAIRARADTTEEQDEEEIALLKRTIRKKHEDAYQHERAALVLTWGKHSADEEERVVLEMTAALQKIRKDDVAAQQIIIQGASDRILEIQRKAREQKEAEDKKAADEARVLELKKISDAEATQLMGLDATEKNLERKRRSNQVSISEEMAEATRLEDEKLRVHLSAIARGLMLDGLTDAQREKLLHEQEVAFQTHSDALAAISDRAMVQQQAQMKTYLSPLKSAVDTALNGLMDGTLRWADVWKTLWQGAVRVVVDSLVQIAEEWVVSQLANLLLNKTTAASEITASAGVAGAAAAAQTAAIPAVGPFAAVEAGLAMASAVEASFLPFAVAHSGADLPGMSEQWVLAQGGEAILPRTTTSNLNRFLTQSASAPTIHYAPNVQALDARGVEDVLKQHTGTILRLVTDARHNGRIK